MSSDTITIAVEKRDIIGKQVHKLRREGMVPANIYERGEASVALTAPLTILTKVYGEAGKHHPVEVSFDGKTKLAMIKDVDIHPVTGVIRHVAFHAVKQNETVEAEVPLIIPEDNPAHRKGLLVIQTTDTLRVKALPNSIPDEFVADVSKLEDAGDHLTVADITIPAGVELVDIDPEHTVATVEEPKDQLAAAAAEAEETAAQEAEGAEGTVASDQGTDGGTDTPTNES